MGSSPLRTRRFLRSIRHRNAIPQAFVLSPDERRRPLVLIDVDANPSVASDVVPEPAAVGVDGVHTVRNGDYCAGAITVVETRGSPSYDGIERAGNLLADFKIDPG